MTSWEIVSSQGNVDLNTALQWLWRCQMLAFVATSSNQNTNFSNALLQTECSVWVLQLSPTWMHGVLAAGPFWFRQQKKMDITKMLPTPCCRRDEQEAWQHFCAILTHSATHNFWFTDKKPQVHLNCRVGKPWQTWRHRDNRSPLYPRKRDSIDTLYLSFPLNSR